MSATAAIAGLGITEMGKVYGRTASDFAGDAIALALEDAGLEARDVDGLLINGNQSAEMAPTLQFSLGFEDLTLLNAMSAFGSTAGDDAAVRGARHRERAGERGGVRVRRRAADGGRLDLAVGLRRHGASARPGFAGLRFAYGDYGPANSMYALAAAAAHASVRDDHEQLGTIAVGQREWALMNPRAQMRKPMTLEDYHASRWVVEPLHLFDCCLVSNGAVAVIVTSAERARDLRQPPVYLRGVGQCAPGDPGASGARAGGPHRRAKSGQLALRAGGDRALGRRRPRALRLLHLHRPRHARGLRVLREGRGRRVRRGRQARPRRLAADEHRRRPALVATTCGASRRCRRA